MKRKLSRTKLTASVLSCAALLAVVAAAQVPQLARSLIQQGGRSASVPSASPTPTLKAPAPVRPSRPSHRDLSRYSRGGTFEVGAELSRPAREAVMAQVRSFLLEHWRGRRLGHIVTRSAGPDGRAEPATFFVEPDQSGAWVITLETGGGAETFSFVEEVELPEDGPPVLDGGAEDHRPRRGTKALHLKQNKDAMTGLVF